MACQWLTHEETCVRPLPHRVADYYFLPPFEGIDPQLPVGWLATAVPGMTAEFAAGSWAADGLLGWVLANLDTFWWQSHTLSHLSRDDLGESDCTIEDGGELSS